MKKTNYEVYEDNGGGLYLCILDENGECIQIFENWMYGERGNLKEALEDLEKYPEDYIHWDGDLTKRLIEEGQDVTAQTLYDDGLGDLIADSTGYMDTHMGFAGREALDIPEGDD